MPLSLCAKMYLLSVCSVSLEYVTSMSRVLLEYVVYLPRVFGGHGRSIF